MTFEDRHRQRKRKAEIEIIIYNIEPFLRDVADCRILEFGSGDGWQIPYLRKLGNLSACDIYKSEEISRNYPDIEFVTCDIRNTPFYLGSFDAIFSNHVLEHIKDIKAAFAELKRIGDNDCVYIFTVPTNIWLLLSVPAQCYNMLRRILNTEPEPKIIKRKREGGAVIRGWRKFLPVGHGYQKDFFRCFNAFRVRSWEKLFSENGFALVKRVPLLLYAPSEFPIVPTTGVLVNQGIYSSAMFILKKK